MAKPTNSINPINSINVNRPKATFFVLAWIAKKLPHLVREIHSRGHEVASHGCNHDLPNKLSRKELQRDLSDSKKKLEDVTGKPVYGYRAPNFAIDDNTLKTIQDSGYRYDSSFNSFSLHGRYGQISLNGSDKKGIAYKLSDNFCELPISNLNFWNPLIYARPVNLFRNKHSKANLTGGLSAMSPGRNKKKRFVLPWGGGAYFRLLPYRFFRHGVQSILKKDGAYVLYIHPWELDPEQPRIDNASYSNKFKHYTNISQTGNKLKKLINELSYCQFITCSQYLSESAKL
jgi:polysaccharide deacetylase family protein (PEP-CTERM system associated)